MREQDVERIAAEVLAALREGAPAGADRPVGHGETGTGVVPSLSLNTSDAADD